MVYIKLVVLLVMSSLAYSAPAHEAKERWHRQVRWPNLRGITYSWKRPSPSARPSTTPETTTPSISSTTAPVSPPPGDRKGKKTPGLPVKQSPQVFLNFLYFSFNVFCPIFLPGSLLPKPIFLSFKNVFCALRMMRNICRPMDPLFCSC